MQLLDNIEHGRVIDRGRRAWGCSLVGLPTTTQGRHHARPGSSQ